MFGRPAMGFATVRAGTRVLMLVLVQAGGGHCGNPGARTSNSSKTSLASASMAACSGNSRANSARLAACTRTCEGSRGVLVPGFVAPRGVGTGFSDPVLDPARPSLAQSKAKHTIAMSCRRGCASPRRPPPCTTRSEPASAQPRMLNTGGGLVF